MPTVSIIINCHNGEKFLREAIDSIYSQTFKDWEIILWDDDSTDKSEAIAKSYDERLRYFKGKKSISLGQARNFAIEKSKGKFIGFLDQDDLWLPKKLEKQIPMFERDPGVGLVFSDAIYFSGNGKNFKLYGDKKPQSGNIFPNLLKHYNLCIATVVVRREALIQIEEMFDDRLNVSEESDVFMRIAYKWKCDYADDTLSMYRIHQNNLSSKMSYQFPKENEIILNKLLKINNNIALKYKRELDFMKANIQYGYAMEDFNKNRNEMVRKRLSPYLMINKKLFIPYMFSFFHVSFYNMICKKFKKI